MATAAALFASLALVACGGGDDDDDNYAIDYPTEVVCSSELTPSGSAALPKNIIFILGDGMGPVQQQAGRILKGGSLGFESLSAPVFYNTDSLTTDSAADPEVEPTDSAAAATGIATGVRVFNDVLSVDAGGQPLETVLEMAQAAGKSIGLVTTSAIYDASPMAFAAHVPSRDSSDDIVTQLLTVTKPDLILGGGVELFEDNSNAHLDTAESEGYFILRDADDLAAWDPLAEPQVMGVFEGSAVSLAPTLYEWYLTPTALRDETSTDPTLAAMAARALERLAADDDGFFLFIENEHLDTIGHVFVADRDTALRALAPEVLVVEEVAELAKAWIEDNSSFEETLLVVAADHESGGYTLGGNNLDDAYFWGSPLHTRQPVAIYAAGSGSENLASICRVADVHWLLTGQLPAPN